MQHEECREILDIESTRIWVIFRMTNVSSLGSSLPSSGDPVYMKTETTILTVQSASNDANGFWERIFGDVRIFVSLERSLRG